MSIEISLVQNRRRKYIIVNKNDTIIDLKKKYGCNENYIWKLGDRLLEDEKRISDYDIEEDDTIDSILMKEIEEGGGVFGVETIDVSKNNTKNIGFGHSGKHYRLVSYGLNIQSKCKNKNCLAYEDTIYVIIGFVTNWNLLNNLQTIVCPECKKRVKPLNFGFYNCNYEIEYEKDEDDDYKDGKVNGHSGQNDFIIFDEYSSGKATFTKLIFNITENN